MFGYVSSSKTQYITPLICRCVPSSEAPCRDAVPQYFPCRPSWTSARSRSSPSGTFLSASDELSSMSMGNTGICRATQTSLVDTLKTNAAILCSCKLNHTFNVSVCDVEFTNQNRLPDNPQHFTKKVDFPLQWHTVDRRVPQSELEAGARTGLWRQFEPTHALSWSQVQCALALWRSDVTVVSSVLNLEDTAVEAYNHDK